MNGALRSAAATTIHRRGADGLDATVHEMFLSHGVEVGAHTSQGLGVDRLERDDRCG